MPNLVNSEKNSGILTLCQAKSQFPTFSCLSIIFGPRGISGYPKHGPQSTHWIITSVTNTAVPLRRNFRCVQKPLFFLIISYNQVIVRPENFTATTSRHAAFTQFNFVSQDLIALAQEAKVDLKVDHFGLRDSMSSNRFLTNMNKFQRIRKCLENLDAKQFKTSLAAGKKRSPNGAPFG